MGLDVTAGVSDHWRPGDRRFFGAGSDVHRGDCAGAGARPDGRVVPIQRGLWDSRRVPVELPHRPRQLRRLRMALEARRGGDPGAALLTAVVLDSAESTMAHAEGPAGRGRGRTSSDW